MRKLTIAFDIDGTLRCNCTETCRDVNDNVVAIAKALDGSLKNARLIAWSGGGAKYAAQFVRDNPALYNIFGERCYSKLAAPAVDLAFDDQHEFGLGTVNLIVRAK